MVVEGYPRSMPVMSGIMKKMKTKVVLVAPLMVRDRNVGLMLIDNIERPHMFTPETVNLAVRFANKVAAAMENARKEMPSLQLAEDVYACAEGADVLALDGHDV